MEEGRKHRAPGAAAGASRASARRMFPNGRLLEALAFVAPLAVAMCAIKAYKTTFALWPVTHTFGWMPPGRLQVVGWILTSPLFALTVAAIALAFAGVRLKQRRFSMVTGIAPFVVLALVLLNSLRAQRGAESVIGRVGGFVRDAALSLDHWIVLLRADLLVAVGYFLLVLLVRSFWRGRGGSILFGLLNAFLLLVAGLELANYLKTGVTDAGPLLVYLLENAADLAPLLRSETDLRAVVALVLPLSLLLLTPGIRRLAVEGRDDNPSGRPLATVALVAPVLALVAAMFAMPNRAEQQYHRFEGNVFASLSSAVWRSAVRPEVRAGTVRLAMSDPGEIRFEAESSFKRLNVVVVMLESVRAQSTGLYNNRLDNTPFLESLARK